MCGISIRASAGPGFVSQDYTLFQVILTCPGFYRVELCCILSTLQLHSGVVCCSPLPCAIMFDSSSVPRLFSVYDYVRFFIFLQTYDGKSNVPGTCPIRRLLTTPPGAIITPPGVCCIAYRVECADEFFRLVRACFNNCVVCSGVNFLSCSIAKAVAIASAISSFVAVYRFI